MSQLNYELVQHESLADAERLFKITAGSHSDDLVKIAITRTEDDFDGDGVPDQINLKVLGELVCSDLKTLRTQSGAAIRIPAKVESIMTSALAEGTENINEFRSNLTDDAIHRVLRQKTALTAWECIPSESPKIENKE